MERDNKAKKTFQESQDALRHSQQKTNAPLHSKPQDKTKINPRDNIRGK